MRRLQRAGGVAALVEALAYVVGFVVMLTLLDPGDSKTWTSARELGFILERRAIFELWTMFIYVVFGVALVVLALALHERLKERSSGLLPLATAFALIWAGLVIASGMVATVGLSAAAELVVREPAQAALLWAVISAVHDGLGGGVEIVGGLWVLLISLAAWRSSELPRPLNYLGVVVGLAGLLTIVPGLGELGTIFGLGQIPWFVWVGVVMLRRDHGQRLPGSAASSRPA